MNQDFGEFDLRDQYLQAAVGFGTSLITAYHKDHYFDKTAQPDLTRRAYLQYQIHGERHRHFGFHKHYKKHRFRSWAPTYHRKEALSAVREFRDWRSTRKGHTTGRMPRRRRRRVYYGRTKKYSSRIPRRMRGRYRRTGYYGRYNHPSQSQELKFHDFAVGDTVVATTGTVSTTLVDINQGTTESNRLGRKAFIRYIQWNGYVTMPLEQDVADIGTGDAVRLLLILDKQANGALPAVTDILKGANIEAYFNLVNQGRFRILWDKHITMNRQVAMTDGTNTASTPQMLRRFSYRRHVNIPIEYSGTTGAITEIRSNNLVYLAISQNGLIGLTVSFFRFRFDG